MKLIPKAKPVKIRIKSGGEEHSSLDSLKRNFNISDIQPLLDGRLVRWLKQQGENDLADIVSKFDSANLYSLIGIMQLMKCFFEEYITVYDIHDVLSLLKYWLKDSSYRKNGEYLFNYVIVYLSDTDEKLKLVKYLYKNKAGLQCPQADWYSILYSFAEKNEYQEFTGDPDILYFLGKMLWEKYRISDLDEAYSQEERNGLQLIEKAARLGCQEANLFVFEYNRNQKEKKQQTTSQAKATSDAKRFDGVNKDRIRIWMKYNWGGWNVGALAFSKDEYPNDKEKNILEFLSTSHYLGFIAERFGFERALQYANSYFVTKDTDILRKEKRFIIGLLYLWIGYRAQAKDIFTEIKDYKLANYMLGNTRIIDQFDFKSMSFQNQLTFIKDHLFDYE